MMAHYISSSVKLERKKGFNLNFSFLVWFDRNTAEREIEGKSIQF